MRKRPGKSPGLFFTMTTAILPAEYRHPSGCPSPDVNRIFFRFYIPFIQEKDRPGSPRIGPGLECLLAFYTYLTSPGFCLWSIKIRDTDKPETDVVYPGISKKVEEICIVFIAEQKIQMV